MNEVLFKYCVLLIEDDDCFVQFVCEYFDGYEFVVMVVWCGDFVVVVVCEYQLVFVIFDLMLLNFDGMEVCCCICVFINVFVLILIVCVDVYDQVVGFEMGVDDYVMKLIELCVLVVCVCVLLCCVQLVVVDMFVVVFDVLVFGEFMILLLNCIVMWCGELVELKIVEFNLLLIFVCVVGIVLSCDDILKQLCGIEFDGFDCLVDFGILKLCCCFEDVLLELYKIKMIWGCGYLFSFFVWDE